MTVQRQASGTTVLVNAHGEEVPVPDDFCCPIMNNIMVNPVMTRSGFNFERSAILSWLQSNDTCPLTRRKMKPSDLVSNRQLEMSIKFWKLNNEIEADSNVMAREVEASEDEDLNAVAKFMGYLSVPKEKGDEVLMSSARRNIGSSSTNMSLVSLTRASQQAPVSASTTATTTSSSQPSVPALGGRSNRKKKFLSRLLRSAARELDEMNASDF